MSNDRERFVLTLNPLKVSGSQLTAILTAVVQAIPEAEWSADSYNGIVASLPDVVVPAEWIEGEVKQP